MKWLWLSNSEMVLSEAKSDVWSILLSDVFFIACNLVNVPAKRGPHPCVLPSIWKTICARHLLPILRNFLVQLSSVHNMRVPLYTRNIIDLLYRNLVFVQQSCFFPQCSLSSCVTQHHYRRITSKPDVIQFYVLSITIFSLLSY